MSSLLSEFPPVLAALKNNVEQRQTARNIILACDGTGDLLDGDNSNVVKFFAALKKDDPNQVCYYQSGIGTYSSSYKGSLKSGFSAGLDMAIGASLGVHVRDAYSFLMQNYREGDKISLIGFSRGAYTVRGLAGMIHKVGLLPAHNQAQIAFAYKWYKDNSDQGWKMSAEFKRTFSIDVNIHFLGCWDTVASVGVIPRILPFAKTGNPSVRYFRHALALDERRSKFKQNHWFQRDENYHEMDEDGSNVEKDKKNNLEGDSSAFEHAVKAHHKRMINSQPHYGLKPITDEPEIMEFDVEKMFKPPVEEVGIEVHQTTTRPEQPRRRSSILPLPFKRKSGVPASSEEDVKPKGDGKSYVEFEMMRKFNEIDRNEFGDFGNPTDVKEVWFAGSHASCGGGAVPNETRHMLSRIPLRWMIRETFQCDTGILFHADVLAEHGLDIETLWPKYQPRKAPSCSPPPSALDEYAVGNLPSLKNRRDSVRRQLAINEMTMNNSTNINHIEDLFRSPDTSFSNTISSIETHTNMIKSPSSTISQNWKESGILPETHEDYFDCLAEIKDQLEQSKSWWLLEFWPIKYRIKNQKGEWKKKTGMNLGRHRTIRTKSINLHWTVIQRQENTNYRIKCLTDDGCNWNVVY